MPVYLTGVNHQTASVAIREKFALGPEQLQLALGQLCALENVNEAAIISTCNRSEFIIAANSAISLNGFFENLTQSASGDFAGHLYEYAEADVVSHLFRVASGLDSMIIGEAQILGQIKQAWQIAKTHGALGGQLDKLFQHTFSVAKRCRTETGIGKHAVSVAYASVALAKNLFSNISQHQALLIGAGETIELVAQHLCEHDIQGLHIANRSANNARELAAKFKAQHYSLDACPELLERCDIVISSTAAPGTILNLADCQEAIKKRRYRPLFMVDLAVPRDIDPAFADYEDNYLYTVDDLQDIIQRGKKARQKAAADAEKLVADETANYKLQQASLASVDHIRSLRDNAEQTREDLLKKALQQIANGADTADVITQLSKQLTNKLLHNPTTNLRNAAAQGDEELLSAASRIFLQNTRPN